MTQAKAIPGKQALRELLDVEKDFFSYPGKITFYFSLPQKVAHGLLSFIATG